MDQNNKNIDKNYNEQLNTVIISMIQVKTYSWGHFK